MKWLLFILYGLSSTMPFSVAGNRMLNVALNSEASQSSLDNAPRAIDGNRITTFVSGSCTVTKNDTNPWWRVDLLKIYKINAVIVTSSNVPEYSLDGAEIWLDTSTDPNATTHVRCAEISSFPVGRPLYLSCNAVEGQYVSLVLPGNGRILSLCEVEVYTTDFAYPVPNVAVKGDATQSSTLYPAGAYRAIDGKRETFYTEGSCSHTAENETDPWWRVDLGQIYIITTIKITNRGDCCADRLDGAEIRIGNSLENDGKKNSWCANISHIPLGNTFTFACESGSMEGRYVSVVIFGEMKTLTLCEVEVYANPTVEPVGNVAYYKPTDQSSSAVHFWPGDIKNPISSGFSYKCVQDCMGYTLTASCCSQTYVQNYPWWRVDLQAVHKVSAVIIYNRDDCCSSELIGAKIRIGNSVTSYYKPICAVVSSNDLTQTFYCSEMEGRYVTVIIEKSNTFLTMCRVEVYGSPVVVSPPPSLPPIPSYNFPTASVNLVDRTATLVGGRLCWSDALRYCRQYQWDLLTVHSQDEQTKVEQLLKTSPFPLTDLVWLGLRRELMGMRWFWMTGEAVVFSKWLLYPLLYPNPCGGLNRLDPLSWKPMPCEHLSNFICQTAPIIKAQQVYYFSNKFASP